MKTIFTIVLAIAYTLVSNAPTLAQGCVAVRAMSSASSLAQFRQQQSGKFQVSLNYRHLHSYKHYIGDEEQKERVEQGTNVINDQHSVDLGLWYQINNRFSVAVNLPFSYNDRSQLVSSDLTINPNLERFHTHAKGLGDVRVTANYWLINPAKLKKYNVLIGLGVKLPTGNANVQDNFVSKDKEGKYTTTVHAVDQSIQLGDQGFGINAEVQGYWQLAHNTTLYYNGFYLVNPREQNDVLRSGPITATTDLNAAYMSVSDQFAARIGISQSIHAIPGLSLMLGGRVEGVPSHDVIGGSKGFRRPGYIVSVEPGVMYAHGKFSAVASVPVALYRNRTKSYADLQDPAGLKHGDAAFADYFVSVAVARWF